MSQDLVIQNLIDLVKIDSPSGSEDQLAEYLVSRLAKSGFKFTSDSAGNLFSRVDGSGKSVVVCAHLDTVEPGRGIKPIVKDGVINSDGTTILGADNKATLAAIITTLETVNRNQLRPLEIIFTTREETEGGINQFDFSKVSSQSGLIADRAEELGAIVLASPWILNLQIEIIGRPSHAGSPENGINSLTIAAKAISSTPWGRIDADTTTNIGLVSGGSAINTVPGRVKLVGEIRSFKPSSLENTLSIIKSVFTKVSANSQAQLNFVSTSYCTGYNYDQNNPAVAEIAKIMETLSIAPYYQTAFGASDANAFAAHNIAVINIGDGCRDPHTVGESVSIDSLKRLSELFHAYLTYRP